MKIKEMFTEYRPREKMELRGARGLSDCELLALVLGSGTAGENVVNLSERLITRFGLSGLGRAGISELTSVKGIGKAKASTLLAMFELSNRFKTVRQNVIKKGEDVYSHCRWMTNLEKEYFLVLLLDSKNRVVREEVVSVGTLNSSLVHPREVFRLAVKEGVNSLILVHNHPSGDPAPSSEDRKVTDILKDAGKIMGIEVLDHVIIGDGWKSV